MEIQNAIRDALLDDTSVAAAVVERCFPDILPQNTPRPAIVSTVVSTLVHTHLQGPSNLESSRVQIDVYADTRSAADDLSRLCQGVLHAEGRGEWGSLTVRGLEIESGIRHDRVPPADGSDEWLYVTSFDVLAVFVPVMGD